MASSESGEQGEWIDGMMYVLYDDVLLNAVFEEAHPSCNYKRRCASQDFFLFMSFLPLTFLCFSDLQV